MQFEELNKKIKEAAEQHHPAYDEQAWKKMEKMLDKHMPQEKDRRRIIFFILFFLLIGGGVFVAINKPWQQNSTIATNNTSNKELKTVPSNQQQQNKEASQPTPGNSILTERDQPTQLNDGGNGMVANTTNQIQQPSAFKKINRNNFIAFENNADHKKQQKQSVTIDDNSGPIKRDDKSLENNANKNDLASEKEKSTEIKNDITQNNFVNPKENSSETVTKDEMKKNEQNDDKQTKANPITKAKKNNRENKFLNGLGFSISAGPDVSKAGSSKFGKTTVAFGAAISYSFKKFTLKTGLFSASKIYSATENNYKLNYTLPSNIKFEGADANCRVLEIPFSLSYNFASKNNHSWFAAAGLSSYLMSREDYKYWYSNSTSGSYYSRDFEYKNRNKHYFSVLGLSAGYTRKLTDKISITAEPYVRIPMKGIGMGSVHLNSGGVLFSIGIQPFDNKKKK